VLGVPAGSRRDVIVPLLVTAVCITVEGAYAFYPPTLGKETPLTETHMLKWWGPINTMTLGLQETKIYHRNRQETCRISTESTVEA